MKRLRIPFTLMLLAAEVLHRFIVEQAVGMNAARNLLVIQKRVFTLKLESLTTSRSFI